jgi:hypothetical protein
MAEGVIAIRQPNPCPQAVGTDLSLVRSETYGNVAEREGFEPSIRF